MVGVMLDTVVPLMIGAVPAEVLTEMLVAKPSTLMPLKVPVQVLIGAVPICRPVAIMFAPLELVPSRFTLLTVTVPTVQRTPATSMVTGVVLALRMVNPEKALPLFSDTTAVFAVEPV